MAKDPSELVAFTDGGCRGNPGVGGWAFVIVDPKTRQALERAGGEADTTNNRMELSAAVQALSALRGKGRRIVVHSDSIYMIKACSEWMPGWKARGWARGKKALKNLELLQRLDELMALHNVRWKWVPGHAGVVGNEHVDRLANEAMDRIANGRDPSYERRFQWTSALPETL